MKKILIPIAGLFMAALLFSCGGNEKTESTENTDQSDSTISEEVTQKKCIYSYNAEATVVQWTAFKTTGKVGVGGEFTQFEMTNTAESENIVDVFANVEISIPVTGTDTKNPERDQRIINFFFGTFTDTDTITGKVESFSTESATLQMTLNGITKSLDAQVSVEDARVIVSATLDLSLWNGQDAIDALNEECKDLHAGEDGITKLWPDVDIKIVTDLNKNCE